MTRHSAQWHMSSRLLISTTDTSAGLWMRPMPPGHKSASGQGGSWPGLLCDIMRPCDSCGTERSTQIGPKIRWPTLFGKTQFEGGVVSEEANLPCKCIYTATTVTSVLPSSECLECASFSCSAPSAVRTVYHARRLHSMLQCRIAILH